MITNRSATLLMAANGISQNFALPDGGGLILSVLNTGPQVAFVETSSDANMTTSIPTANVGGGRAIVANVPVELTLRVGDTRLVAISAGNSSMYVSRGQIA